MDAGRAGDEMNAPERAVVAPGATWTWRCLICRHRWQTTGRGLAALPAQCPACGDGRIQGRKVKEDRTHAG